MTLTLPEHEIAAALIQSRRLCITSAADRGVVPDALTEMPVDWASSSAKHAG